MPYVGSVPQSGWTFTDPTQLFIIVLEFGSTGAAEISVFQRLVVENGRKPFRLAPCPTDIPLHASLLLPVPPPGPIGPVSTGDWETPEQAVKKSASANRAETQ